MLLTAAMLALTLCMVVVSSGGTYARLSSRAPIPASTISSGSATLTVSALSLPTTLLYPGLTLAAAVTVTNTGDVPLVLFPSLTPPATTTALSGVLTVGVAVVDSPTACTAATAATWTKTFAGPASDSFSSTLPIGGSATLCVQATLPMNAPAASSNSATNFALVITGIQN
ncbi:hypothetical protein [Cryobacterium melibiosiphilum]|nr:hypothetical protein [Cryobacterium melibiosiphilum]